MESALRFTGRNTCWKLVTEPNDSRLCMPHVFVKMCLYNIPNNVFLITGDGNKHPVSTESSHETAYLTAGWAEFREYYSIGMLSMLVFCWDDNSRLDVALFKPNGGFNPVNLVRTFSDKTKPIKFKGLNSCWKLITSPQDSRLCMPEVFVPQCGFSVPKSTLLVTGNGFPHHVRIKVENGTAYLDEGWTAFSNLHDVGAFNMVLFSWEHPSKLDVALFQSDGGDNSLNKEEYEFDTFISVPGHPHIRLEWGENCSAPPKICVQRHKVHKRGPDHESGSKRKAEDSHTTNVIRCSDSDSSDCGEISGLVGEVNSPPPCLTPVPTNSNRPGHYEVKLTKKATSFPYTMELPMRFASAMLKPGHNDITFDRLGYGFWYVSAVLGETKCLISKGWDEFVQDNNLQPRDIIVFSREGTTANLWKVLVLEHKYSKEKI